MCSGRGQEWGGRWAEEERVAPAPGVGKAGVASSHSGGGRGEREGGKLGSCGFSSHQGTTVYFSAGQWTPVIKVALVRARTRLRVRQWPGLFSLEPLSSPVVLAAWFSRL